MIFVTFHAFWILTFHIWDHIFIDGFCSYRSRATQLVALSSRSLESIDKHVFIQFCNKYAVFTIFATKCRSYKFLRQNYVRLVSLLLMRPFNRRNPIPRIPHFVPPWLVITKKGKWPTDSLNNIGLRDATASKIDIENWQWNWQWQLENDFTDFISETYHLRHLISPSGDQVI